MKKLILSIVFILVFIHVAFAQTLFLGPLSIEIMQSNRTARYVTVQTKITNVSGQHINDCDITCVLKKHSESLCFEKNTVIYHGDGGLAPNNSIYVEFIIMCSHRDWNMIEFQVDKIK